MITKDNCEIFLTKLDNELSEFECYFGENDNDCFIISGQLDYYPVQDYWKVNDEEDHYIDIEETNGRKYLLNSFKLLFDWNQIKKLIEEVADNEL